MSSNRGGRPRRGRRGRRAGQAAQAIQRRWYHISSGTAWVGGGLLLIAVIITIVAISIARDSSSGDGALTGDHWHATLAINVCGEGFNIPSFSGGLHSHAPDGVMHIHPQSASETGSNASLGTYFENVMDNVPSFFIDEQSIQIPGEPRYADGELCFDGRPGTLRVTVNGSEEENFMRYLPRDGDVVNVEFSG